MSSALSMVMVAGLVVVSTSGSARAQSDHCDPDVEVSRSDPLRYSPRGEPAENTDRCEGTYRLQVSSYSLQLASFTLRFDEFDPAVSETLLVRWDEPYDRAVHLRATGLRDQLYYKMDTVRPKGTTSFRWPTGQLSAHDVRRKDIGILGWTTHSTGTSHSEMYVPLHVAAEDGSPNADRYQVLIVPLRELEEVYVTLSRVEDSGESGPPLMYQEPLDYGYYPPQQPIEIDIPIELLQAGGLYRVDISARYEDGGSTSADFLFQNPDR